MGHVNFFSEATPFFPKYTTYANSALFYFRKTFLNLILHHLWLTILHKVTSLTIQALLPCLHSGEEGTFTMNIL